MNSSYKNRTIKYAWSLIVDQFLALLAGAIVTNILGFFVPDGTALLKLLIGAFVIIIICYVDAWGKGSVDYNRVKTGVIKNGAWYGFAFGLVAMVPSFIIAFLAFLAESGIVTFYNVIEVDVFTFINRFWQLPLSSLFVYVDKAPILNLAIPFLIPAVSGIGYLFGFYGVSIKRKIVFKDGSQ